MRRVVLFLLLALLAVAPAPAGAAATPPGSGVELGLVANTQAWGGDVGLFQDRVLKTGVRWLREELPWGQIERRRGRFDWTQADRTFAAAARRGVRILPLVQDTPPWAGRTSNHLPRPADYARFVTAAVRRYGTRGSFWRAHPGVPRTPVVWWELWNEPWERTFAKPRPSAPRYTAMVRAAVGAARQVDPGARFLAGAASRPMPSGRRWAEELFVADPGFARWFDGVAVHPYGESFTDPDEHFLRTMEGVRATMVAHGAARKPFWLTEFGFTTCAVGPRCVSEAEQARLLEQAVGLFRGRYRAYVRRAFVYHYNDQWDGGDRNDPERWFGLVAPDGSPKPAFGVLRRLARTR